MKLNSFVSLVFFQVVTLTRHRQTFPRRRLRRIHRGLVFHSGASNPTHRTARTVPPKSTSLGSSGTRSRTTTSAPRDVRPPPPLCTPPRATGNRSRAPTAAPGGAGPPPPPCTSNCPMGSRSNAPTSLSRNSHPLPPSSTYSRSTRSLSCVTTSAFRGAQTALRGETLFSNDQSGTGAAPSLSIRASRLALHSSPQSYVPSPPPPCTSKYLLPVSVRDL